MSHRKFEHPRHGNLGFLPKQRCRHIRGRIRSFPKDDASVKPHLTAFIGFKAGMTHIVRDLDKAGSKMNKKEVVEAVTIVETPPMMCVGYVGYRETPNGLRCIGSVWAQHLSEECRRRFYRNWRNSKKKAFTKYSAKLATDAGKAEAKKKTEKIVETASIVRIIAHTQMAKLNNAHVGQRKAFITEVQVNGGSIADKVKFSQALLEKEINIDGVFQKSECVDICSVTRGHGFEGVIQRWGCTRLPRKTHRGLRKVACIGSWHPERVSFTVSRAGQHGFHHRTELNKKIYMMGKPLAENPHTAKTDYDFTEKAITPMGGFPKYGTVKNAFVMLKGAVGGPVRRSITLRRPIAPQTSRALQEKVNVKFVDTSSKRGHGRFQTLKEKSQFVGTLKKHGLRQK
jgi:large subunit ribosomal protein L3e